MSRGLHSGLGLLVVTLLTTSPALFADPAPSIPPGYKLVNVPAGDRTIPVLVKQQGNPFSSSSTSSSSGMSKSFSETNALANKKFDYGGDANFQRDANPKGDGSFPTKAYQDPSAANGSRFDTKANLPANVAFSHGAAGADRAFPTGTIDEQSRASFAGTSTSSDQNHTAALGGPATPEQFASSPFQNKQYLGPGAQNVPAAYHIADNVVVSRMSGLPNRPLSIDEVRNLINHDAKPDTDIKPEEASKPLNDPAYQPEPLRDTPPRVDPDDKDDPVPAPGMIAAPENAEPLPQK